MPTYYPIDEAAALRAKEMNSYYDYKPGSATAAYRQEVEQAAAIAGAQKARVDPMYHEKIDRLLDAYARKLAENINKSHAIAARCPSVLIAGPANFPVRKKEKQNRAVDANTEEWMQVQGLLDKIKGTGMGGISSDDANALQKLREKLAQAVKPLRDPERKKLEAAAMMAMPHGPDEVRRLAENLDQFDFVPDVTTPEEYGKHMIRESGHFEYDPNLEGFYNFQGYGLQKAEEEQGQFNIFGYIAYHGALTLEELLREDPAEQYRQEQGPQMGGFT